MLLLYLIIYLLNFSSSAFFKLFFEYIHTHIFLLEFPFPPSHFSECSSSVPLNTMPFAICKWGEVGSAKPCGWQGT